MPIVRTYCCVECNHQIEVWLENHQLDDPPPECPRCAAWDLQEPMRQEFKAPGIINHTPQSKAEAMKDDILANDYHVADYQKDKADPVPKVRYKDQNTRTSQRSTWQAANETLAEAITLGRQNRLQFGSGLDILQRNLANGTEVDLIKASKERMKRGGGRVW